MLRTFLAAAGVLAAVCAAPLLGAEIEVAPLVKTIQGVGPKGEGNVAAGKAWRTLSQADVSQLPEILAGFDDAGPLAVNYLRAAVDTIAESAHKKGEQLPLAALNAFLADRNHAPRARRAAFEWIVRVNPAAEAELIPSMLDDPSLELRREAVAHKLEEAKALADAKNEEAATAAYRAAMTAARDLDQIKLADKALEDRGIEVDLPAHFGFIQRWQLIGPFDNTDKAGFAVAYPPENEFLADAEYAGKAGNVSWKSHTEVDDYGLVDLNKVVGKHMGAIVYARAEFIADEARPVDVRLGCINANKVWLNGELLTANEVYHANRSVDQYVGEGRLKKGKNVILVKICQNEQTENWAQDWQFQLRVCDKFGTAVLSQDRPLKRTAALDRLLR
ncbi:hypothetical protein [Lignipirellula cremea]|uniref:HEAT repeat protein n=1 Tax=Lignipirellula cremea TaxID=2528010 RepID=A0A518DTV0_9BACT|nr:hypothetical protein [Lignipirellula cremea]QDU95265.1 hypothetical protein Pla8534_30800 [Lignipirellula cremea]